MKTTGLIGSILAALILFSCRASTQPPGIPADPPGSASGPSTEFCRAEWSDYASREADSLGADFYIGAWTRVDEPIGFAVNSNDYPFVMPCAETVNGARQLILTISGNIGYDAGAGSWAYNQNITSNSGDYSTIYVHADRFPSYPAGQPDESAMRGWVYAAWHFKRSSEGTIVNQFLKFGVDGAVIRTPQDIVDGTGVFSEPMPPPSPEYATPVSVCVGGGPRGWGKLYMQYAKAYRMAEAPTEEEVDAISRRTSPDPQAWADWPLVGADLRDVSGHGRDLAMVGNAYPGPAGPAF
jgi:hypothetical protein